tara:strand:+ start:1071 stop:1502 length:432 start_codon:yes stop_codon:yes gene_type:complete
MADPITNSVVGIAGSVLNKFVADKNLKMKLEHELKTQLQTANLAQNETNKIQAAHPSLFIAGARPAIMWICAIGLFWEFFLKQVLVWSFGLAGMEVAVPDIQTEGLMTLTLSLLGLSGMRSFEKSKGVARENLTEKNTKDVYK